MVVVLGRIELDSKDRDAFVRSARSLMKATRQESGCVYYAFAEDVDAPACFWLSECWTDAASLAAHLQTAHIADFRSATANLTFRSYVVKRYDGANETVLVSR